MIDTLLFALFFFLSAGVANASPVFANKIPGLNRWNTPLDFGKTYKGQRIFGENKRWRGVVFGTLIGGLTGILAYTLYPDANVARIFPLLPVVNMFILGSLLGFGALLGDAIESFFKRQRGVPAGQKWFPFDQIDYIIGGLVLSLLVVRLSPAEYLAVVVVWFLLHIVSAYVGYLLKLKDTPI